jgi:hypothetical protein
VVALAASQTRFEAIGSLLRAATGLRSALGNARQISLGDIENEPSSSARSLVLDIVDDGETMLLYNRRLANSRHAYGFLHSNELLSRISGVQKFEGFRNEFAQLLRDSAELLAGYDLFRQVAESEVIKRPTNSAGSEHRLP